MMLLARLGLILVLLAGALSPAVAARVDADIAEAVKLERAYPDVPNSIGLADAYAIQAIVVRDVYGTKVAGYKAGLTSPATQQRFGVDKPVVGVLPESGRLASGASLALKPGLKIEVEIGYLVGTGAEPAAMLPVIELPRLDYEDMTRVTLVDIVATNVSAYCFIAGASGTPDPKIRSYEVSLEKDGAKLFSALGADALGDPRHSYEWMVGQVRALGYELRPGMLMITGALGRVTDAEPGTYVAHFGPLGELKFRIEGKDHAVQATRQ